MFQIITWILFLHQQLASVGKHMCLEQFSEGARKVIQISNATVSICLLLKTMLDTYELSIKEETISIELTITLSKISLICQLLQRCLFQVIKVQKILSQVIGQLFPRALIFFILISDENDPIIFLAYVSVCSVYDVIRYCSILFSTTMPFLKIQYFLYRGFALVKIFLSLLIFNDYIYVHAETIQNSAINTIRVGQLYMIGLFIWQLFKLGGWSSNDKAWEKNKQA